MCCSVNGIVCLVCCVFVNCLVKQYAMWLVKQFAMCVVKQFAMCLGVVAILLLNVMEMFSMGGGALLDRPCMVFQRMCVLCM